MLRVSTFQRNDVNVDIFIFGFHISNASKQLSTFAPHECYKYVTLLYEQIQIVCVCAWIQFSNALEFQPPQ